LGLGISYHVFGLGIFQSMDFQFPFSIHICFHPRFDFIFIGAWCLID
jgi:hypothetical protein